MSRRIKIVTWVVVVLAVLWSAWWFVGSEGQEAVWEQGLSQAQAAGYVAEAEEVAVVGFPFRFDTKLRAVTFGDPRQGWEWSVPNLNLFMLAYRPNFVRAALPAEQIIRLGGQQMSLVSERMLASVRLAASTDLGLERISLDFDKLALSGIASLASGLGSLDAHIQRDEADDAPAGRYLLSIALVDLVLPDPVLRMIDPGRALGRNLGVVKLDARVTFDRELDRHAFLDGGPQITGIELVDVRIVWGDVELGASGALTVDADGYLAGVVAVSAVGWERMLDVAVAGGWVDAGSASVLRNVIGGVATYLLGQPDRLTADVVFANGQISVKGVTVARAPRIGRPN